MSYIIKNGKVVSNTGTDYSDATNRPFINNNELTEGNHTSQDLGITKVMTLAQYNAEAVHTADCLYIILDGDMQNTDVNYNDLANKPSINGIVLTGNKPLDAFDLYDRGEVDKLVAAARSIRTVTEAGWEEIKADPIEKGVPNTMYYSPYRDEEGELVEDIYSVHLLDTNSVITEMGTTQMDLSDYQKIKPVHIDGDTGEEINDIIIGDGTVVSGINTAYKEAVTVHNEKITGATKIKLVTEYHKDKGDIRAIKFESVKFATDDDAPTGSLEDEFAVDVDIIDENNSHVLARKLSNNIQYECSCVGGNWSAWKKTGNDDSVKVIAEAKTDVSRADLADTLTSEVTTGAVIFASVKFKKDDSPTGSDSDVFEVTVHKWTNASDVLTTKLVAKKLGAQAEYTTDRGTKTADWADWAVTAIAPVTDKTDLFMRSDNTWANPAMGHVAKGDTNAVSGGEVFNIVSTYDDDVYNLTIPITKKTDWISYYDYGQYVPTPTSSTWNASPTGTFYQGRPVYKTELKNKAFSINTNSATYMINLTTEMSTPNFISVLGNSDCEVEFFIRSVGGVTSTASGLKLGIVDKYKTASGNVYWYRQPVDGIESPYTTGWTKVHAQCHKATDDQYHQIILCVSNQTGAKVETTINGTFEFTVPEIYKYTGTLSHEPTYVTQSKNVDLIIRPGSIYVQEQ